MTTRHRTGPPKAREKVYGTVYEIRCRRERRLWWQRRTYCGYIGMYSGDWKERIRQHAYGGGPYRCKPKVWADLIPGYDPNARTLRAQRVAVEQMVRLGSAKALWRKRCSHWRVKLHESLVIAWRRPVHNIQENLGNPKHLPQWEAERQRQQRDRTQTITYHGKPMGRIWRETPDSPWQQWRAS